MCHELESNISNKRITNLFRGYMRGPSGQSLSAKYLGFAGLQYAPPCLYAWINYSFGKTRHISPSSAGANRINNTAMDTLDMASFQQLIYHVCRKIAKASEEQTGYLFDAIMHSPPPGDGSHVTCAGGTAAGMYSLEVFIL